MTNNNQNNQTTWINPQTGPITTNVTTAASTHGIVGHHVFGGNPGQWTNIGTGYPIQGALFPYNTPNPSITVSKERLADHFALGNMPQVGESFRLVVSSIEEVNGQYIIKFKLV